jgi:ribosomal protein S27AE
MDGPTVLPVFRRATIILAVASYRLPAFCPNCGAVFPSVIAIGGGSGVVRGNLQNCPFCGAMAQIADATFRTTAGEVLAAIQAPGITRTMLIRFSAAAKQAYVEQKPPEALAREVEQIHPTFGTVVRKSADRGFYRALFWIIIAATQSTTFDLNRFIDQVMNMRSPAEMIRSAPDPPALAEPPDAEPPARATDETPTPDEPGAPKAP